MTLEWRSQIDETTVRDYAAGKISWREIRYRSDLDNFQVILSALGDLGLRLPRAKSNSWGAEWLAKALVTPQGTT